ncbi:chloride channel protein, partial [Haematococcus lacustris]
MTVALAVICIEISSDVHMLLPVLVAVLTAKWVADAVSHSLYHGLLAVNKYSLDLIPVSMVMHSPVVTLRHQMK